MDTSDYSAISDIQKDLSGCQHRYDKIYIETAKNRKKSEMPTSTVNLSNGKI